MNDSQVLWLHGQTVPAAEVSKGCQRFLGMAGNDLLHVLDGMHVSCATRALNSFSCLDQAPCMLVPTKSLAQHVS